MKQLLAILLCVISLVAQAVNQISVSSASGHPGDIVEISVSLSCTDVIVAGEFHLPLGQYTSYVEGSTVLNADRSDGHTLTAAASNETLVVNVFNMSLKSIKGTNGILFTYRIRLGNEPTTYTINPSCVLSNASGQAITHATSSGSALILSPKIKIVTSEINYGHVPIRSTYNKTIIVKNVGNEPLTISSIDLPNSEFSVESSSFTIAQGSSRNVNITYHPLVRGALLGRVAFHSNAINDPNVYQAKYATVIADPFSVNEFQIKPTEGTSDDTVTISVWVNNMEPLVGAQFDIQLPEQLEYITNSATVSNRCSNHSITSTFSDQKLTIMLFSMTNDTITGNDGELLTFRLRLNGKSGSYYIEPTNVVLSNKTIENMTSAANGALIRIHSPRISCNLEVNVGEISVTETKSVSYTISNVGQTNLTINRVAFLQDGFSIADSLPITISPTKQQPLTIQTNVAVEGDFSTIMQIYSNDPYERMKSVTISGHAFEPNKFTLSGQVDMNGDYIVSVGLTNYSDITALQFDIRWMEDMMTSQSQLIASSRLGAHTAAISNLGDGVYRVIVFSMANKSIADHTGEIMQIKYQQNGEVAYCGTNIILDNAIVGDPFGNSKNIANTSLIVTQNQPTFFVTSCDSYTWFGKTYTESGDYTDTLDTKLGCDSIFTLHLTINKSVATEFSDSAYTEYTWNEQTYFVSGDYTQTFTSAQGCDSVVTLHLTIISPITDLDNIIKANIVIYPNPATENLYVVGDDITSVSIYSNYGQLIGQYTHTSPIDVRQWPSGVYILRIRQKDQYRSYYLIKN